MRAYLSLLPAFLAVGCPTAKEDTAPPPIYWDTSPPDADGDGWAADVDCDDTDAATHPGAAEACDERDNDCDDEVDEDPAGGPAWYSDADGDGYGDPATRVVSCVQPSDTVDNGEDCDDTTAAVRPGAQEWCDGVDFDCDGLVNEDHSVDAGRYWEDLDGDGYGDQASLVTSCEPPDGPVDNSQDCDDTDGRIYPGAAEVCGDGVDNDCDGRDEGCGMSGDVVLSGLRNRLVGSAATDRAGSAVGPGGDQNSDGFDDLLVGAPGVGGVGAAYLVAGPITAGAVLATGSAATFTGESDGGVFGTAVAKVGDVDADGRVDVAIGAPLADDGAVDGGLVALYAGPVAGPYGIGTARAVVLGSAAAGQLGLAVDGLPTLNGDAWSDLALGAPYAGTSYEGACYLVFGPVSGTLDVDSEGDPWWGEKAWDQAGESVAGAGDLDGDGVEDLVVGAPGYPAGTARGAVYVLTGRVKTGGDLADADLRLLGDASGDRAGMDVTGAGDVDGDGLNDLLVGAPGSDLAGTDGGAAALFFGPPPDGATFSGADAVLLAEAPGDEAGWSVAGPGDFDGDDLADLLVGAPSSGFGGAWAGSAFLVLAPVGGTLSLADAGVRMRGGSSGAQAGLAVGWAGDLDRNGTSEVLVGAPGTEEAGVTTGTAYLVFGTP